MNATTLRPQDALAGTDWARALQPADRLALVTALVSRINHDLRTPLNTLAGWTHLLQQGGADPARTRHVAEVFARNVREETLLLEEFVDDARAVTQVLALNVGLEPAHELVQAAVERLAAPLDVHDVRLDLHADLADVRLETDRARATRLIYRVLLAPVRRAAAGGTLRVVTRRDGAVARIEAVAPAARAAVEDSVALDLRVASAVTALMRGSLVVEAGARETRVCLLLPAAS